MEEAVAVVVAAAVATQVEPATARDSTVPVLRILQHLEVRQEVAVELACYHSSRLNSQNAHLGGCVRPIPADVVAVQGQDGAEVRC